MTAKDYLEKNISRDALLGIYGRLNLHFDASGDSEAARVIEGMAAASGEAIRLTGKTLGRYRSSVGAVERKIRRPEAKEEPLPLQGELLEAVPSGDGAERAAWASEAKLRKMLDGQARIEGLLTEIKNLLASMAGRAVIEAGKKGLDDLARLGSEAVRIYGSNKIQGIKWLREKNAGLTLREAKELFERSEVASGPIGLVAVTTGGGR